MTATFYVITVGLWSPRNFRWGRLSPLLTMGDLWEAVRGASPGLLMRVRSESDPNAQMSLHDEVESVIGIVDPTMRWRTSLAMVRAALTGLKMPATSEACWKAATLLMSRHPAAISTNERQAHVAAIRQAMEGLPQGSQATFEAAICHSLCQFMFVDNDLEAAAQVPFEPMLMLNIDARDLPLLGRRQGTIETLAGSAALGEAFVRLLERMPDWWVAPVPRVVAPGAEEDEEARPSVTRRPESSRPAPAAPRPDTPRSQPARNGAALSDDAVLARMAAGGKVPVPEPDDEDYVPPAGAADAAS
jgi:hypothetical protein